MNTLVPAEHTDASPSSPSASIETLADRLGGQGYPGAAFGAPDRSMYLEGESTRATNVRAAAITALRVRHARPVPGVRYCRF